MHSAVTNGNDKKLLPKRDKFYDAIKLGVGIVAQMAKNYIVKSASQRWSVKNFYNILDLAAINAYILYQTGTGARIWQQRFLLQLAEELCYNFAQVPQKDSSLV